MKTKYFDFYVPARREAKAKRSGTGCIHPAQPPHFQLPAKQVKNQQLPPHFSARKMRGYDSICHTPFAILAFMKVDNSVSHEPGLERMPTVITRTMLCPLFGCSQPLSLPRSLDLGMLTKHRGALVPRAETYDAHQRWSSSAAPGNSGQFSPVEQHAHPEAPLFQTHKMPQKPTSGQFLDLWVFVGKCGFLWALVGFCGSNLF